MTKAEIYARVQKALKEYEGNGFLHLKELSNLLENDVMQENAKTTGTKSTFSAAVKLIKNCPEYMNGAFIQNEKQYICSGFYAVTFFEQIDLPKCTKEVNMDMQKFFTDTSENMVELDLPKTEELKQIISILKAEKRIDKSKKHNIPMYDFGDNLPLVNAEYLLNIMQAIEATKIKSSAINLTRPIYIKGKKGEAVLMPIRKK